MTRLKRTHVALYFLLFGVLISRIHGGEYEVVIKQGDTIYSISREHGIPVDIIAEINKIKDPSKIKTGTTLRIPIVYTIRKGDTLTSISKKFNVTISSILSTNGMSPAETLKLGNRLYILVDSSYHTVRESDEHRAESLDWPHPGKRQKMNGKLSGVVIFGSPGDSIRSVSYGRVIWAGPYRGYGKLVIVKSNADRIYIYAGNDTLHVKVGDTISKHTVIGSLGPSSHDGKAKALFCIYYRNKPLDPYRALRE